MQLHFIFRNLIIYLATLSCFFLCAASAGAASAGNVRVALVRGCNDLSFQVSGNYEVIDGATNSILAVPKQGEKILVELKGKRIALFGSGNDYGSFSGPLVVRESGFRAAVINSSGLVTEQNIALLMAVNGNGRAAALASTETPTVRSSLKTAQLTGGSDGLNLVTLNSASAGKRYRGDMEFLLEDGGLTAVNVLNIEDYLRGVVPAEILSFWPAEALKAQAVAARNYALQQAQTSRGPFDVYCDVMSQVYEGYDAESATTNKAVEETRGVVMLSGGKIAQAYFHSSSGGCTENSEDVWYDQMPYIKSKQDPYDKNSDYYNWQVSYTTDQLIKKFASAGYQFKKITDIDELALTSSGQRVKKLEIKGEGIEEKPLTVVISNADNVRMALGLKSSLFQLTRKYDKQKKLTGVEITGSGSGHGLGMSQYGARGMAEEGYKYQDILKYYYSGVELVGDYGR